MKKSYYIHPETILVKVNIRHHILELSNSGNKAVLQDMGSGDGDDAASRRGDGWFDDED